MVPLDNGLNTAHTNEVQPDNEPVLGSPALEKPSPGPPTPPAQSLESNQDPADEDTIDFDAG